MPTKGEIAVALRLTDEKIASDLNKAMAKMKANLSAATKAMTVGISGGQLKMGVDTVRASAAVDTHTKKVQKLTSALKEQKKAQTQANQNARIIQDQGHLKRDSRGRFVPGTNIVPKSIPITLNPGVKSFTPASLTGGVVERRRMAAQELRELRAEGLRGFNAQSFFRSRRGPPPILNPVSKPNLTPPIIPKSPGVLGGKPINSQLLRNVVGAMAGSSLAGPMGAGIGATAMGATGPMGIAIGAATAALAALKSAIMNTVAAYDQARQMYAKQLMSGGMARGFIVRQSQLAEVLGVGENQVMQFGTAIGFLGHQLEFSTRTLTRTNSTLTATSWHIKIMEQNFKAMWAEAASNAAPAIISLVDAISSLAKVATFAQSQIPRIKKSVMDFMLSGKMGALWKLNAKIEKWFDSKILETIKAPDVPVSINRLPASSWEKMGLVLGQGGGNDYQKKTADGVTKTVVLLAKMNAKMAPGRGQTPALNPQFSQF